MERVCAGDESALCELFDHTGKAVLRLLRALLPNPSSADEVLTDVYAEAWRRRKQFDPARCSPLGWLTVIARTRAIDCLRRIGRDRNVVLDDSDWFDRQASAAESAACTAERKELAERVRAALARIPAQQRRILWAAFFTGASHSQIAAASGVPLGTVKSRIRAAMAQLRPILVDYADDPSVDDDLLE